ncbi:hypothetical protein [Plantactinospora sp. CA-290183]|uniref:hypothetical protein n=1 Tax=Plantactinospora sp. CA-290183 TaxID=3240006 RepID=UPI003D8F7C4D
MTGTLSRSGIAVYAERIGFGRIARVHWQRRESALANALAGLSAVGLVLAALIVFGLLISGAPQWRLPVLAWTALAGATYACWRWGPVDDPDRRLRLVVTERGLLVWQPESAEPPTAVPWPEARVASRAVLPGKTADWLVWSDGTETHELALAAVVGRGDLVRAVGQGAPVPGWPIGRLAATGGVGLALAVVLGLAAGPVALDIVLGERPHDITALSRMCEGGDAFGRAVPYRGPGPHPVAVYTGESDYPRHLAGLDDADGWPPPDDVQLVGCLHLIGRVSPEMLESCDYEGGYTLVMFQGRYRIDVHEVRTGRRVASVPVDGTSGGSCAEFTYAKRDATYDERDTAPDDAAYAAKLSALVDGEAVG